MRWRTKQMGGLRRWNEEAAEDAGGQQWRGAGLRAAAMRMWRRQRMGKFSRACLICSFLIFFLSRDVAGTV
jgi:hypothetical protein